MKALIRRDGETVREADGIEGIDWKTGAPLTNEDWCGGAYTLVDNYVEPESETGQTTQENKIATEKVYTVDGKKYTKEQILNMLN